MITIIFLIILVSLLFHSCGNTYGDITKEQAEKYVKNKFGDSYSVTAAYEDLDSSDKDIMLQYGLNEKDKLYIFSDSNEFQFSMKLKLSRGWFNASYYSYCDYFPQYVYFHPEYYQKLFRSGYKVTADESGTGYCLEISDFDQIKTAAAFADGFINSLEPIWCTDYKVEAEDDDTQVSLTEANIYICTEGNILAKLHYLTSENSAPNELSRLVCDAEDSYIDLYRTGRVHGKVSDEEFEKRPAEELSLMYQGEPTGDKLVYDEETGEYFLHINYRSQGYGSTISSIQSGILNVFLQEGDYTSDGGYTAGWDGREISFFIENGVISIKCGENILTPRYTNYGYNHDYGEFNGEEYGIIKLSEVDIQQIFGVTVEIDQRTATAVIKEIQ